MSNTQTAITPKPKRTNLKPRIALSKAHLELQARAALSTDWAAALSAIAAHVSKALGCEVKLGARLCDATLDGRSTLAKHAAFAFIEWSQQGALTALEIEPALLSAVLTRIAGCEGGHAPTQLTRIDEAALGWLLLGTIGALRSVAAVERNFAPRLVGLTMNRSDVRERLSPTSRHLIVELTVEVGGLSTKARFIFPALALQAALAHEATSTSWTVAPEVLAAGFDAQCRMGMALLGQSEVASLRTGDVVVFAGLSSMDSALTGSLRLLTKHFTLHAELRREGLSLTRSIPRTSKESPMSNQDPSLPVEIEVELTKLRLSLADLSVLRAGSVLPLHINAAQTVTLRIGDKTVAKAELVDIEGEVGARIIALL